MNNLSSASLPGGRVLTDAALHGSAHWWFAALDHRWFSVGAERWLTQVVGVHVDGHDVWIQLQSLGEQLRDFTIRVRPGMSVADVVHTVETMIRDACRC